MCAPQVFCVNVLLWLEAEQALVQYIDQPDVIKTIKLQYKSQNGPQVV